jgi:hypothetical protein
VVVASHEIGSLTIYDTKKRKDQFEKYEWPLQVTDNEAA